MVYIVHPYYISVCIFLHLDMYLDGERMLQVPSALFLIRQFDFREEWFLFQKKMPNIQLSCGMGSCIVNVNLLCHEHISSVQILHSEWKCHVTTGEVEKFPRGCFATGPFHK